MRLLWESGVFDRVAATVNHAMIGVLHEDDHDVGDTLRRALDTWSPV